MNRMDDLISRQAAIDVADAVWSVTGDKNVAKVWDQLKNIPSAQSEQQWIPVTERLPESKPDDLEYPTVIIDLGDGTVELDCYYESTNEWGAGENFDSLRNPIAWMPLPKPIEEGDE